MSLPATEKSATATDLNRPGRFGAYGGRYVPETLMAALEELETAYAEAQADPDFHLDWIRCCTIMLGVPLRSITRNGFRNSLVARRFISSAKTCCIPERTRSTTVSARVSSRVAWANIG